jgi:predicted metal-dependent HD superfamily phosphohydrolase
MAPRRCGVGEGWSRAARVGLLRAMSGRERWSVAWAELGAVPPEGLLAELRARYCEAHRFYHTLQHLDECFAVLGAASSLATRLPEVELALWFHDAIYDTHAQDNEDASAQWAERSLLAGGAAPEVAARVRELVLATKHAATPESGDAQLLVDVDLAILGAPVPRFAEYERQVRQEYGWVPERAFREGRARILQSFLARPSLYGTAWFAERLEAPARDNLERSLQQLDASSP